VNYPDVNVSMVKAVRQDRTCDSLNGTIIGDQIGTGIVKLSEAEVRHMVEHREVPKTQNISWPAAIALDCLNSLLRVAPDSDLDAVITSILQYYKGDALVCAVSAMILGAYWADDMDFVLAHTRTAIEAVTSDSETVATGVTMAVAAAWAWRLQQVFISSHREFFDLILAYVPPSTLRERIVAARQLPDDLTGLGATVKLGNVRGKTPLDTIPFVLWCIGECLGNYEEAIWTALEARGASDVICALVGGVVALHTGSAQIPDEWMPSEI
jgi:ADP-ribosylglycohydrolase